MVLESREMEEYLEIMYRKKQKGERITTTGIAKELSVSPASVSEMFKKLEKKRLVKLTPYKGVTLTKKGEEAGRSMLRKHHLLEDFLRIFGLGRKRAHTEACALEHALSRNAERAFERAMACVKGKNVRTLSSLKAGQRGRIFGIRGGMIARRRMMELGLTKGTVIEVIRTSRYGCPIELRARGAEIAIGRGIAEKIYVEVIE
ncbi:MAG: metal-dependent transcriptional regulator [Candidatus Bilamarchaeaceae archaeon]